MRVEEQLDKIEVELRELRSRLAPALRVMAALESVNGHEKPKTNLQWKRQGKYLAAIRTLSKGDRGKVQRERAANGYPAAIRLAKSLRKSPAA